MAVSINTEIAGEKRKGGAKEGEQQRCSLHFFSGFFLNCFGVFRVFFS
jgi:hypothetical protein